MSFLSVPLTFSAHTKLGLALITQRGSEEERGDSLRVCVETKRKLALALIHTDAARATYHFLQAVNEVADHHAQSVELLEHCAEFLAGALAHVAIGLIRLLADDVGGDGGAHVQHLRAFADDVGVIWANTGEGKETDQRVMGTAGAQCDWNCLIFCLALCSGVENTSMTTALASNLLLSNPKLHYCSTE